MRSHRFPTALTALNLVLLLFVLAELQPPDAQAVTPVLRGRALELVDEQGRVRAEIKVLPAQPGLKMPDGTVGYPEAVQLRLIDSEGAPNVKLVATEDGSGLALGSDRAYVQILSRSSSPFVKVVNQDGRQRVFQAGPAGAGR